MNLKREFVHRVQRFVVNPIGRQLPMTMLETIGRKTGQPRRTAVGGRVVDSTALGVRRPEQNNSRAARAAVAAPIGLLASMHSTSS